MPGTLTIKGFYIILVAAILLSCSHSSHLNQSYYKGKRSGLDSIVSRYNELNKQQPFNIEFVDKGFRTISFECVKNGVRYIRNYDLRETDIGDSLKKYKFDVTGIYELLKLMAVEKCLWIGTLAYFDNEVSKNITLISLRQETHSSLINMGKFYLLAYFNEPQLYNNKGVLLDKGEFEKDKNFSKRKIINHFFRKLTDSVAYSISERFR